jgi:hypothetical protein
MCLSPSFCARETGLKRASATVQDMFRNILALPSVVADYTFGTVIVLFQLALVRR